MVTWKNFSANSGAATTTWNYDPYRGFLSSKTFDGGAAGPSYGYKPSGRLWTRTWARNITTTYSYDNGGTLQTITYSDGTTPNVTYTNDRLGRQSTITCNGITSTFAYNTANQLLSESFSGGTLAGQAVTNGYDSLLRRTALGISTQPSALTIYGYDNASRLGSVSNSANSASYTYIANSPLVGQIEFVNSGTLRARTTKAYDNLNRLSSISTANAQGAVLDSHGYSYNNANQRTGMTNSEAAYWVYQYDGLGQVTSGVKYWSDGTPVAGQQFGYIFDSIGNRQSTTAGGDQNGANLRSAVYGANNLNQYTGRTVPNAVDVIGSATNGASVTVNGQTTYRRNDY
jgi:YD repeat-containing protein